MILKKMTFILVLITTSLFAGDRVGNGAGLAESHVFHAYLNLSTYIGYCLNNPSCNLQDDERSLLKQIKTSLPREYETENQVQIIDKEKGSDFFTIEGFIRIAKTGDNIGDPIFVNKKLLYNKSVYGNQTPISLQDAIALMVHEMGHHHQELNHDKLDLLGTKVARVLNGRAQAVSFFPHDDSITATVVNGNRTNLNSELLIFANGEWFDASTILSDKIQCPTLPKNIPILRHFFTQKPYGATLHNLHWETVVARPNGKSQKFFLEGKLALFCKPTSDSADYEKGYSFELSFVMKSQKNEKNTAKWVLDKESFKGRMKYRPWWQFIEFKK